jgi:outer membrane lipoprotein-sorting protein
MKTIYHITIFLFAVFCIPVNIIAQTANADAIIEKASQIYKEWGGMDVKFAANIRFEKNGILESFEGSIVMKKDKFVLKTPDMSTWFDGKTQWTYMHRNKEVNISLPSSDELRYLNPMIILQDYKKDYNVSYIGESTSANAKSAYDVMLTPKKKDDIEKIEVQIEKNTSLPVKLVVTMRNDMRSTVTIKENKASNLPDNTFVFPEPEYPGVEIIDLR